MRNVQWMSAGLFAGLLSLAGPSFADGAPPRRTLASTAAPGQAGGLRPPIQSGAAAAKNGIQVAVIGQSCSETVEPDLPGVDLVESTVELQVLNGTSAPIVVHRDRFRLGAPDGGAIGTSTWFARAPRPVDPGQARTFSLRFMSRGQLSCSTGMVLELRSAVEQGGEGVKLDAIKLPPAQRPSDPGA